jgi:hypothetical protein
MSLKDIAIFQLCMAAPNYEQAATGRGVSIPGGIRLFRIREVADAAKRLPLPTPALSLAEPLGLTVILSASQSLP